MSTQRLAGRAAIITGSGDGIGHTIALAFANAGASVTVVDVKGVDVTTAAIAAGHGEHRVLGLQRDIAEPQAITDIVAATVAKFGRLDCVVNNAADQSQATLEQLTMEHWEHIQAVNVKAALLFAQQALPHLLQQPGSSLVNISSLVADMAMPGRLAYCTSKTALLGLTRSLAVELGTRGIRVNAICPGHIMRSGEAQWMQQYSEREQAIMQSSYALGRVGRPEEVASVAVFLASADASFITGETIRVDGGMSILNPESSVHRAAAL